MRACMCLEGAGEGGGRSRAVQGDYPNNLKMMRNKERIIQIVDPNWRHSNCHFKMNGTSWSKESKLHFWARQETHSHLVIMCKC